MAWKNISMAEKVFAYFLFTVFEVILLSGIVGYCLGWSDAAAPIESDPDAVTYTQMAKNCVNPPPPPPKSEEELEKEERMRALVPGTHRAMVDKDSLSCFGGGSAATRAQQAMDMYRKPSLKGPPPPAPEPEKPKDSKAPLKGPGSDSSDKSSGSGSSSKNTNAFRKGGKSGGASSSSSGGASSGDKARRPPPPKRAGAAARKEEVELV